MNAEIIICTERGPLEHQSKLLVASLRKFGGCFKDLPIKSFQLRKGYRIKRSTRKFFEKHGVEHQELIVNTEFSHYPLANKPLVCAHCEKHSNADYLIFLDSDTMFINEPEEFELHPSKELGVRTVGHKNIGSSDENDPYWKELYRLIGVKNPRRVASLIDRQEILEYYNTGHIISMRSTGLFSQWKENFKKVMATHLRPEIEFYLEQSIFGATVSQLELPVQMLSVPYNYPAYFLEKGQAVSVHPAYLPYLDDIVSLHYHKIFEGKLRETILKNWFQPSAKGQQLQAMVEDFIKPEKGSLLKLLRK